MMVNVAVVGSGYWGKNLTRNFHSLGALRALCDNDPRVLNKLKETYRDVAVTQTHEDLLNGTIPGIDGVVIAAPAAYHYRIAREFLLAGKHCFVEKPLALTVEEGRELVEIAERNRLVLMVGHILQYHPAVLKLKELIDSGELGKIEYLYSNRLNIGKIRVEENILWSFAPHDISVILMLLGEMPESVYATGGSYLQQQIPDATLTTMDFPSGVKGHIFVSWLHPFKEQKLVVVGDKKMAVFDDVSKQKLSLYPHTIQWVNRIPVAAKAEPEEVTVETVEPLREECQHFLSCVASGTRPKTDGYEGLKVLSILQASQESLNRNGCKFQIIAGKHFPALEPVASSPMVSREENRKNERKHSTAPNGCFIHESSYVEDDVEVGKGTKIWHFCHILEGSRLGRNCSVGQNVVIGPDATIGNGCKIQNNVSVYKGVTLEDDVFCGPSMVFTNVHNPRAHIKRMSEVRPTVVQRGATLGANCTIVCGNTVGEYAFIGAGAVITKDVPAYALMLGNPARRKGWMCACGVALDFADNKAHCRVCGAAYLRVNEDKILPA
jgi:UDP-2-acetamido-3-amino-2,3-dideoxy-glucuronate N-acetyltransferase